MKWLLRRAKQITSWPLIIASVAGVFGVKVAPELREHLATLLSAAIAVALFFFDEDKINKVDIRLPKIERNDSGDVRVSDNGIVRRRLRIPDLHAENYPANHNEREDQPGFNDQ